MEKQMISVGIVDHKYGTNTYAGKTEASVIKQIADFCREWWSDYNIDEEPPENDEEVLEIYFREEYAGAWEGYKIQDTELL